MARRLAPLLVAAVLPLTALAQSADRALLTELAKVKAVDAHSHLLINRVEPSGKALAQQRSASDLPLRLRGLGPEWARTWKLLYKVNVPDPSDKRFAEPEKRFPFGVFGKAIRSEETLYKSVNRSFRS